MAINAGRSQGMQVGNGADMVLRHVAEAEGKPVEGLETSSFSSTCSAECRRLRPRQRRRRPGERWPRQSDGRACQRRWPTCNRLGSAATRRVRAHAGAAQPASPDTYRMMFTERNERWADWIRARMQTPGHGVRRGRRGPSRRPGQPAGPSRRARPPVAAASTKLANLAFPARSRTRARASPAMVIPGGVAGVLSIGE